MKISNRDQDVTVFRQEANADRAADEAYSLALRMWRVDEFGNVPDELVKAELQPYERSCDCVTIVFNGYRRSGNNNIYTFNSFLERGG